MIEASVYLDPKDVASSSPAADQTTMRLMLACLYFLFLCFPILD